MRSLLELSEEVRSCLTLNFSVVGFLGGMGGYTSAGEFDCAVQHGQFPVLMRKGGQAWLVQDYLLYTIWSGDALSADWPLGVHSMAVSRAWNCAMFDPVACCQWSCNRGRVKLTCHLLVIHLGNSLAKMHKWHNITTCSSINFTSEASMIDLVLLSVRHGDSCSSFSEGISVDCSDVDVFWVTRDCW